MTEPCNNDSRIRAGTDEPLTPPLDLDGMRHAAAELEQLADKWLFLAQHPGDEPLGDYHRGAWQAEINTYTQCAGELHQLLAGIQRSGGGMGNQQSTMRRDLARWEAMSPRAIAEGSPAQFMYAMDDAQHDIAALAAEIERLRAFVQSVANTSNDPHLYDKAVRLGARP